MAKARGFELVARHVPVRQRSSFYKEIVTEFLASGQKSVVVSGTDRKPATLVQGLRKVIQADGVKGVKVLQRSQDVYLSK
jgi:methylmalonyl-CoA mutase cobalamin-binding subunit